MKENVTVLGDIYNLGGGMLICGDSTDQQVLAKLLGNDLVDLWLTDPPITWPMRDAQKTN